MKDFHEAFNEIQLNCAQAAAHFDTAITYARCHNPCSAADSFNECAVFLKTILEIARNLLVRALENFDEMQSLSDKESS